MQGTSRRALAAVRDSAAETLRASSAETGTQVLSVASLLGREASLRNALADNGATAQRRVSLAEGLLSGKVSASAIDVVTAAVGQRWSRPRDLVEGLELLGAEALLAFAESEGRIDAVEEELFRFGRVLDSSSELQILMTDPGVGESVKAAVVGDLLAGRAQPETVTLLTHVVSTPAVDSVGERLDVLLALAAERRQMLLADVRAPVPLTDAQAERLAAALSRIYGQPVSLAVSLDEDLLGGAVVRVGDEIIDGSVASRLAAARRSLTQ